MFLDLHSNTFNCSISSYDDKEIYFIAITLFFVIIVPMYLYVCVCINVYIIFVFTGYDLLAQSLQVNGSVIFDNGKNKKS
jgi:hypothetical protein